MGAVPQFETMGLDDFEELLLDKPDNERWELINGRVIRGMVGARWEHNAIIQNIAFALRAHFKATGRPCRAFQETFYVKKRSDDFAVLPDIVVRCGQLTPGQISVDDPSVVFEILSPGTEQRDRSEKWIGYRKLASLQHFVLVDRDRPLVEVRTRDGLAWKSQLLEELDSLLHLEAIDFTISLAAIYEDVLAAGA